MIYTLPRTNLVFQSQKSMKEYVKKITIKHTDVIINSDHKEYNLYMDMWDRHPTKSTIKKPEFLFMKNNILTGENHLTKHEDFRAYFRVGIDNWESYSLLKICIIGKVKTDKIKFGEAMRFAIDKQIQHFRFENDYRCVKCNCEKLLDVDHVKPFKAIRDEFVAIHGICTTIGINSVSIGCDVLSSDEYRNRWCDYHKQNAILQFLCTSCHKKKTWQKVKISTPKTLPLSNQTISCSDYDYQCGNQLLNIGKYNGNSYIFIKTDQNYCNWVRSVKNPSGELKKFANWLKIKQNNNENAPI